MSEQAGRIPEVGLALGNGRAVARAIGSEQAWSMDVADSALLAGDAAELTRALADLRAALAPVRARKLERASPWRLHVALLPPLADLRTLDLPRLSRDESRLALAANAPRYFPAARGDDVIGIERLPQARDGRRALPAPALATAAPGPVIRCIEEAARAAGWSIERIVPAGAAWAAASPDGWLLAPLSDRSEALRAASGRPRELRRFPTTVTEAEIAEALGATPRAIDPWLAAAVGALRALDPELASAGVRALRKRREHRRALSLSALAALCGIAAVAVHAWGLSYELNVLRGEREALRPRVEEVLAARDALDQTEAQVAAFERAATTAPRWSEVIAALAHELPHDAHLTSLVAVPDSMTLDIVSASAAGAFEAVRAVPGVRSVSALAPVRMETRPGGGGSEQLQLAARFGVRSGEVAQ